MALAPMTSTLTAVLGGRTLTAMAGAAGMLAAPIAAGPGGATVSLCMVWHNTFQLLFWFLFTGVARQRPTINS